MTVIATDGVTIAADGMSQAGGTITGLAYRKLRVIDRVIYGFSGSAPMFGPIVKWHRAGASKPLPDHNREKNKWTLIVVDSAGIHQFWEDCPHPDTIPAPWAWGSDPDAARGMMLAGKTPAEAVALICATNVYCGGEIQVINIAEVLAGVARLAEAAE